MQYTPHYNLNLPEGTDIVNPLVQDNPNYSAIDTALYNNKLRVVGTATHVKTGTNHALTLGDSDINQFKFIATGDYVTGDTFTVDGVTVTPRIADGSSIPTGAFKINSTVLCILDGTVLNLINVDGTKAAAGVTYSNATSGLASNNVQSAIDELAPGSVYYEDVTVETNAQGYADIRSYTDIDTVFAVTVIGSTYRQTAELFRNTADASNMYAYVHDRGYNGPAVAETQVTLRIWKIRG